MKIGFVGLGTMGHGMAINLHKKCGEEVIVYDVDSSKLQDFVQMGIPTASGLADIGTADIILLSLPNTVVVEKVVEALIPHLHEGCIVADLSTIDYSATLKISAALEKVGVAFMDAPVSGMKARAENGTLTVMCGGAPEVFEKLRPCFECFGNKVLYMGTLGSGQLTKLINQLLFDINAAALAEILPMSVKMGLDPQKVGEVVNSGTGRSYASEFFIPRVLKNDFTQGYPMASAYKDLACAAQIGAEYTIPMPVLAAATSTYQMALCRGYGKDDKGGMIHVFEELLNVKYREE